MQRAYKKFSFCFLMVGMLVSCQPITERPNVPLEDANVNAAQAADYQIARNREFLQKERASIESYIKDRQWTMERTGNGLYFRVVQPGNGGPRPKMRDQVEVQITSYLLDGTLILAPEKRRVGVGTDSSFEMGFHEALLLMEPGMEAVFILPSHLAHGLAGDLNKVPPMSALVYEIQLLSIF